MSRKKDHSSAKMNRFGRPRFRGASAPKPYSTRPSHPSNNSGLLGAAPSHPSGGGQYGSYQSSKSQEWQPKRSSGSLLDTPPNLSSGYSGGGSSNIRGPSYQDGNMAIPPEVRKLMQTLNLSRADIQKLSKLPENELSENRLAEVIEDLKQGKQRHGGDPSNPTRSISHKRAGRNSFDADERGLLGHYPGQQGNFSSGNEEYASDRRPDLHQPFSANRHKPTGIKVTVKPVQQQYNSRENLPSNISSGFGDRRQFARSDRKDDYYDRLSSNGGGSGSADRYDQQRSDSFSQNNRRFNNRNINEHESDVRPNYNNERRAAYNNREQRSPNSRGSFSRPGAIRNVTKPASSLPSLMELNPKPRGGLLGNPIRPNAQGLESLVSAVGGGSAGSASLLAPLMLATQSDPSVLEAQIQAMKAIQAQAIKLKQGPILDRPRGNRGRIRARRRSPPPARAIVVDKQLEEEAKKEAQEMRATKGRVLYIKYKSSRVLESDLKQLASAFGKVTNTLLIKPKIKNGHFQVFMEFEQSDCAAAMLEQYMAKAPNIKGCPVDVRRSNYADLKLRRDQVRGKKRSKSASPDQEGSAQPPHKRDKKADDKPNLSITASDSDRKVVHQDVTSDNSKDKTVIDAREILNRSREVKKELEEKEGKDADVDIVETEKGKEEIVDPLDAIADELALDEEFDLMHEMNYGRDKKKNEKGVEDAEVKEEERKNAIVDLERTDLDLDDVNVDENVEEDETAGTSTEVTEEVEEMEVKPENELEGCKDENEIKENKNDGRNKDVNDEDINKKVKEEIEEDEKQTSVLADGSSSGMLSQNVKVEVKDKHPDLEEEKLTSVDPVLSQEPSDPTEVEDGEREQSSSLEEKTDADNQEEEEEDEVGDVPSVIEDILNEVLAAKDYLGALTKVTKAKAAQALAKKMKVCLETAVTLLNGANAT